MVTIKKDSEIEFMKQAGSIVASCLNLIGKAVCDGVSTLELDNIAVQHLKNNNAKASFYRYNGYPKSICASIDDEVVHGIPSSNKILRDGQIVSIDFGAVYKGWHGDAARTFPVGNVSEAKQKLMKITELSFWNATKVIKAGAYLRDISEAIQDTVESHGFSVVRDLVGHGIGREMHEDPSIPNFVTIQKGIKLESGMTLAIEPMVCMGGFEVDFDKDGWTVRTRDRFPSSHYENTVLVTQNGFQILTTT